MARGPHVVVVGAGHGGIAAAQACARIAGARVTLVEPRITHLLKTQLHETIAHASMPIELPLKALLPSNVNTCAPPPPTSTLRARWWRSPAPKIEGDFLVIASGAARRDRRFAGGKAKPARRVGTRKASTQRA